MLFISKTRTAPRPALWIAARARPKRYSCRRWKLTRSSQSTFMRPGAGSEATGNSGFGMLHRLRLIAQPVVYVPMIRFERETGSPRFQFEKAGEVLVAETVANQVDHYLMHQSRDREGDVRLAPDLQTELEVLAQQVTGEGGSEIEIDQRRGLIAAGGGPHDAGGEKIQDR